VSLVAGEKDLPFHSIRDVAHRCGIKQEEGLRAFVRRRRANVKPHQKVEPDYLGRIAKLEKCEKDGTMLLIYERPPLPQL